MPTGGRYDVVAYETDESSTAIEGTSVITAQGTAPTIVCNNGNYIQIIRKVFNFASAADAHYWATLQGTQGIEPSCEIWDRNEVQPRYSEFMAVDVVGASAILDVYFTEPRADVANAASWSERYEIKVLNVISDILPSSVDYYHTSS